MNNRYNDEQAYGGREAYVSTPEELMFEREMLIAHIDDILSHPAHMPTALLGDSPHFVPDARYQRCFEYIEDSDSDHNGPLVEKVVSISYGYRDDAEQAEHYKVTIASCLWSEQAPSAPFINTYDIYRSSTNGTSLVYEPDVIGASGWNYTTRDATSYDHAQLSRELELLSERLQAAE